MLLANMAVAARILRSFPLLSVLRRHTSPQEGPLADAARLLRGVGLEVRRQETQCRGHAVNGAGRKGLW